MDTTVLKMLKKMSATSATKNSLLGCPGINLLIIIPPHPIERVTRN